MVGDEIREGHGVSLKGPNLGVRVVEGAARFLAVSSGGQRGEEEGR